MLKVGMIGCGKPYNAEGSTGFGMAHWHAEGYRQSGKAQIVALADISEDNARAFQVLHGSDKIYTDYHEMLAGEKLDIVSISTWPHLHVPMVIAAAESGVRAVHCEKPMATSWSDCKAMAQLCDERGVQLTFNHQRRFNEPFLKAKELLKSGAIGELLRIEARCGDIFDWGTHWFDMMFFYNDETPAQWVFGAIDWRGGKPVFGITAEGQALIQIKFQNDVRGLMLGGWEAKLEAGNRLIGTHGVIELDGKTPLRIWGKGESDWRDVPLESGVHALEIAIPRGIADLIDALESGREPELSSKKTLRATELIFASYESARLGQRIDLPLETDFEPFKK